jgi:hypothetical protein
MIKSRLMSPPHLPGVLGGQLGLADPAQPEQHLLPLGKHYRLPGLDRLGYGGQFWAGDERIGDWGWHADAHQPRIRVVGQASSLVEPGLPVSGCRQFAGELGVAILLVQAAGDKCFDRLGSGRCHSAQQVAHGLIGDRLSREFGASRDVGGSH